ncbi:MAG: isoprenylcysteine carboxylmethyltransferase family protein [Candidatus Acidiferrales bacterium]
MSFNHDAVAEVVVAVVAACWVVFGGIFVLGRSRAATAETERAGRFSPGLLLQCLGYAVCFASYRTYFSSIVLMSKEAEVIFALGTIVIATGSIWFCLAAVRTLGKQWALVARVVDGHELITQGPYGIVRNPIYLGMFGLLVATGLAVSRWQGLAAGVVLFLIGTELRIRSEEKLLRPAFGEKFDEYARRVPAFFPRVF